MQGLFLAYAKQLMQINELFCIIDKFVNSIVYDYFLFFMKIQFSLVTTYKLT